jgi:hypothetical protein
MDWSKKVIDCTVVGYAVEVFTKGQGIKGVIRKDFDTPMEARKYIKSLPKTKIGIFNEVTADGSLMSSAGW